MEAPLSLCHCRRRFACDLCGRRFRCWVKVPDRTWRRRVGIGRAGFNILLCTRCYEAGVPTQEHARLYEVAWKRSIGAIRATLRQSGRTLWRLAGAMDWAVAHPKTGRRVR